MNFLIKTFEKTKRFGRKLFNIDNEDKYYTNNPDEKYLFIGGSSDKQYLFVPDNQWKIIIPKITFFGPCSEIYYKHILFTRNSRLGIYVSSNIQENQILDLLVESYKKK